MACGAGSKAVISSDLILSLSHDHVQCTGHAISSCHTAAPFRSNQWLSDVCMCCVVSACSPDGTFSLGGSLSVTTLEVTRINKDVVRRVLKVTADQVRTPPYSRALRP
jgi:hypothetical protein